MFEGIQSKARFKICFLKWDIFPNRRGDAGGYDALRHNKSSDRVVRIPGTQGVQPVQDHVRLYWIHLKLSQRFSLSKSAQK